MTARIILLCLLLVGCQRPGPLPLPKPLPLTDGIYVAHWLMPLDSVKLLLDRSNVAYSVHVGTKWKHSIFVRTKLDSIAPALPSTSHSTQFVFNDSLLVAGVFHLQYAGNYPDNFFPTVKSYVEDYLGGKFQMQTPKGRVTVNVKTGVQGKYDVGIYVSSLYSDSLTTARIEYRESQQSIL